MSKKLIVVKPTCDMIGRTDRLDKILNDKIADLRVAGTDVLIITKVTDLSPSLLEGTRVLFAISLSEAGINIEYYRLLEFFRAHNNCLRGSIGGIIVDGSSDLFTKALARRIAFSANAAGCLLPGKSLVEATGSLRNFHVLAQLHGVSEHEAYAMQANLLIDKILNFDFITGTNRPFKLLALHSSSRKTSNTLLLWDKVKNALEINRTSEIKITEISLQSGTVTDCRGCKFETCRHFGEDANCFYGDIMVEQVYPAILECDAVVVIAPNYNDALSANLTAAINRLTALFHTHDFSHKRIYAIVVSGYSGGDIVAEQILGAFNFNKNFILPPDFSLLATANDPRSVLEIDDINAKVEAFARRISLIHDI